MDQRYFKRYHSLLSEDKKNSLVLLNGDLTELILHNREYSIRCHSQTEAGREELEKRLSKARQTFFNQEHLINWLCKIKEDAKLETDKIAIRFAATMGQKEDRIDFEKVGWLAGIYDAADTYLNEIMAATRLPFNKAHHQTLDRLEQLDALYIKNDYLLPGYYQIQKDKRIKKHDFEINNLNTYWEDYLSLKDKHQVSEDFGDKSFLLHQYHIEFVWQLIKTRPREEVKAMLDYHYYKYAGSANDFLHHIEYRILPMVEDFAKTDALLYRQLVAEWLREKKFLLSKQDEDFLRKSVVAACAAFLNSLPVHKPLQDENKYNTVIRDLLQQGIRSKGWFVNDQSLGEFTDSESTAHRAGIAARDLLIVDEKQQLFSALECFRLRYVPRSTETHNAVSLHLSKIFRNEITGISPLFMIIYCEAESFAKTWKKYLEYVAAFDFERYALLELKNNVVVEPSRANLKLAISVHAREESSVHLHHLFINMQP